MAGGHQAFPLLTGPTLDGRARTAATPTAQVPTPCLLHD